MSWWGQSPFDEIVEKATSELLPGGQEDLALNLEISDQIRSKKVNAKDAMRSIKKRIQHKNPNVQLAALSLVDTCVKNSGELFVKEIASREFMDTMVSILKAPTGCNMDVRNKLLTIIQTWGLASKNKPILSYMYDTYALLKAEGLPFPQMNDNIDGILLETAVAPEWSDSDVCERCRTAFTLTNRKHHCRNCGGTFCQPCSAKTMSLPHLGINEHVRVCDGCYIKLKLDRATTANQAYQNQRSTSLTTNASTKAIKSSAPRSAQPSSDQFDDDIKKAIELSLQEAEQQKNKYSSGYTPSSTSYNQQQPQQQITNGVSAVEEDPDLAAAIAASLRDMEISQQRTSNSQEENYRQQQQTPAINANDLTSVEMENILLFSTLMERVYATGGDVSNDNQINQLYTQIGALQPKLVKSLNETIRKKNAFIELHEKLTMVVKAYDKLLEERIAGTYQQTAGHNTTSSPLYQQYQYQPAAAVTTPSTYNYNNTMNANYSNQTVTPTMAATSVPPSSAVYYGTSASNAATATVDHQYQQYQPMPSTTESVPPHASALQQQQKQPPVDEAPLIDL
ncbi:hypothetical protein BDF20DRAFT_905080 [Mycotypha africana]|uniref:uncharacterized protein n=1 Tax=Mycotypha africana TaxID=64632 RepID=UPI002301B31B|nr:uncharacterized protein BDF20DRAFT_905080 [Mycotypha africana]KAI8988563.1 hypothetical protein BDF20DRAFT_905080 [Mycotypha africana]